MSWLNKNDKRLRMRLLITLLLLQSAVVSFMVAIIVAFVTTQSIITTCATHRAPPTGTLRKLMQFSRQHLYLISLFRHPYYATVISSSSTMIAIAKDNDKMQQCIAFWALLQVSFFSSEIMKHLFENKYNAAQIFSQSLIALLRSLFVLHLNIGKGQQKCSSRNVSL